MSRGDEGETFRFLCGAIIERADKRMLIITSPHQKHEIIKEMVDQLKALAESWEAMTGTHIDMPLIPIVAELYN